MTINITKNAITLSNQSYIDLLNLIVASKTNLKSVLASNIFDQLNSNSKVDKKNQLNTLMGDHVESFVDELQAKVRSETNGKESSEASKVVRLDTYKRNKD